MSAMTHVREHDTQAFCPRCGTALAAPGATCPRCTLVGSGSPAATPDEAEIVRQALDAEYDLLEELGRGGMAIVYRARERALDRDVAIKVLPLARTFDAELVERFQREARLSAALEHPHIIPIYRVGREGSVSYFVMKYVNGPSLATILEERGRLEPKEVEAMLLQVSDALDHAHRHGVIHRDVKPDNIMKDGTGRYVVMDFGIAKSLGGSALTQTGGSIGTPRYMSPEQGRGGELDGRSDYYSLGVVAYHCLTGVVPFEGDDALAILYSHLHDPLPEPRLESEDARRVFDVVRRLLAKDAGDRLGSHAEIARALSAREEPAPAPIPGREAPASRTGVDRALRVARRPRVLGGVAVAIAVFWLLGRGGAAAQCREALRGRDEGDRVLLMDPVETVDPGKAIEVSYVMCGLDDDQPFSVQLTIRPANGGGLVGGVRRLFNGRNDLLRMTWEDRADGTATARSRQLDPVDLEPGPYRLDLRLQDDRGRGTEASHDFTVLGDAS